MYVESFHNLLESVYFSKKQNKRVDDLLVILLKLSNDKNLDQIVKHTKGKITHRIKEIRHRHKNCESVTGIEKVSEIEWVLPSASQARKKYSVYKVLHVPCNCKLKCNLCCVCIHMYTCNCPNFLSKTYVASIVMLCIHVL